MFALTCFKIDTDPTLGQLKQTTDIFKVVKCEYAVQKKAEHALTFYWFRERPLDRIFTSGQAERFR